MATMLSTAELVHGHRYRFPDRRGGSHDGVFEGSWDGLFHFAGLGGFDDFAFPTTLAIVEGDDLGPGTVLDLTAEEPPF